MNKLFKWLKSLFQKAPQLPVGGAFDIKGLHDDFYNYETFFGSSAPLPKKVWLKNTRVQDQSKQEITLYACTAYSATHASNELTFRERGKEYNPEDLNGVDLWGDCLANGANKNGGRTLVGPIDLLRQRGIIAGYTIATTLDGVKQALAQGNPVCSGACNIMWNYVYSSNVAKRDNQNSIGCHAFTIQGYDDEKQMLICKNSYGPNTSIDGYFYVEYENFDKLGTNYVLLNKDNKPTLDAIRRKLNLKLAKDRGVWNGNRENDTITKQEWDIVCKRLNLLNQTYRKILRGDAVHYLMEEEKRINKLLIASKL